MKVIVAAILAAILVGPFSGHAYAITDGQDFQDWRAKCVSSEDKNNAPVITTCHVFQDLLQKETGKRVLHIAIGSLPKQKTLTMIITLPLGIALPQGMSIRIDDDQVKTLAIQACFPNGCQAAFQPDDKWVKQFTTGSKAEVIFHNIQNQAISIPISLKGISDAIKALRNNEG